MKQPKNDTTPKTRKYLVLDKETVKRLSVKTGLRAGLSRGLVCVAV